MIHRDEFGDKEWLEIVGDDTREFSLDKGAVSGLYCPTHRLHYVLSWLEAFSPVLQDRKKVWCKEVLDPNEQML